MTAPTTKPVRSRTRKAHWIPVVAGFVRKGDLVLVGQRPENHSLAGQWEFPGGKIESGETPEQALIRELSEELGIEAEVGELKLACTHHYGDVNILILFFEILFWKGEPKAKHHLMLEWIKPQDLTKRPIPEANKKILDRIFKALGAPWPKSR
jgi:8-oxo-dGTP diphosphatase